MLLGFSACFFLARWVWHSASFVPAPRRSHSLTHERKSWPFCSRGGRSPLLLFLLLTWPAPVAANSGPSGVCRFGEALHPGPASDVWISTSNPSGLRGKVEHALEFGCGVHCFSETQLSSVTLPQVKAQFRALGKTQGRNLRTVAGAAAPLRAHSDWAGHWSGVLVAADWPLHPVRIPWPPGVWETARVQLAQVLIEGCPLLVANVYGYSRGHTQAAQATEALLEPITREVVFGRIGPRIICGDLNADEDQLLQTRIWRQQGWLELQELLWQRCGRAPLPTCKDTTRRDFLYLSPEAATLCIDGDVTNVFQEHATVSAKLRIASNAGVVQYWPKPAEVPWSSIALDGLYGQAHEPSPPLLDSTARLRHHAYLFEKSLDGYVNCPGRQLPAACFGRAKFTSPATKQVATHVPRASRDGDECMQSDLLSLEVRRWFKQLRKLQSLRQSLQRARFDFNALEYRGSLWDSICRAKGFRFGFRAWWPQRLIHHAGSPSFLPIRVPTASEAEAIFLDFRENYRKFESWHIAQRGKILMARHDASRKRLFQDLRGEDGKAVDGLVHNQTYEILAVDSQDRLLHLDKPLDFAGHSEWRLDGRVVSVTQVATDVCQISGTFSLPPDGELEQLQYVSSPSEIHTEFVQFWTQRWNKPSSDDQWTRILDFARAFLPHRPLTLPAISQTVWLAALRRFRPRAARGPDGYARDDLLHMPPSRIQELLLLLSDVEAGAPWPEQLVIGLVSALQKLGGGETVKGYRPICVFSIIYRCWASIRAKQVLTWLSEFMPTGSLGFMPGREATEAWYLLESLVECAVQDARTLSGYGSDLVRAFNNLPRRPLFEAARLLGLSDRVLRPWQTFTQCMQRRFVAQGAVSEPVFSTCGFAEGCPLSTVAMSICSFLYHEYMRAFAPSIDCMSYVDNLLGVGSGAFEVALGLNSTRCLCDSLALELDSSKTYAWSTDPRQRNILRAMHLPVVDSCRELGGFVSFGPATRNNQLVQRCEGLAPVFAALKRSKAPWHQKVSILPIKFWSRALHGVSGCPVSDSLIQSLRTQAVRALQSAPAGSSPALRLSLCQPMTADPGFYQCWSCLTTIRRICGKQPRVLDLWTSFMQRYDGKMYHGPFSKLLAVLHCIGWHIAVPPIVVDTDNLAHNLLRMPLTALRALAERAWLAAVAHAHGHRRSMQGLAGIEVSLARLDQTRLNPTQAARVAALQSGALMFGEAQSRFDMTQSGLCPLCSVPDNKEHRVRFCPKYAAARHGHEQVLARWDDLPPCLKFHLLPPACKSAAELRALLHAIPDGSYSFQSLPVTGTQHLFTDGACSTPRGTDLSFAAWSVVNATSELIVANSHLPGLHQSAPRAELYALLVATNWVRFHGVQAVVWGDSFSVLEGFCLLLEGEEPASHWDNLDLWHRVADQMRDLQPGQLRVQHVTSHLDVMLCETAFEEWAACWNQHADTVATCTNVNRTWTFQTTLQQALDYHSDMANCLRALRAIYFHIAEDAEGSRHTTSLVDCEDQPVNYAATLPAGQDRTELLSDKLPLTWCLDTLRALVPGLRPRAEGLLQFLVAQDSCSTDEFTVSWLELVGMVWLVNPGVWLVPTSVDSRLPPNFPTVAEQVRIFRRTGAKLLDRFDLSHLRVHRLSGLSFMVGFPLDGIRIGLSLELLGQARALLRDFAGSEQIRSVTGLERRF